MTTVLPSSGALHYDAQMFVSRMRTVFFETAVSVSLLSLLISCGGGAQSVSSSPQPQTYQSLNIAPVEATVRTEAIVGVSGMGNRFIAVGRRADGSTVSSWSLVPPVVALEWSSSVPEVATIDSQGRFTTLSPGTTTITAKLDGLTSSTTLVVTDTAPILKTVQMDFGIPDFDPDMKVIGFQFQPIAGYDDGSARDISREGIWVSSDVSAATVDSTGHVSFKSSAECDILFLYGLSYNRVHVVH